MPWSNSVFRRYTPPTCTLEIRVKRSLLSLWTGQCNRKYLRFELIFDDPQSSTEQEFMITGDALALEELYQAVKQYTEKLFHRDRAPTNPAQFLLDDFLESTNQPGSGVAQPPLPDRVISTDATVNQNSSIQIQSQGEQNHQLSLGLLATEESGPMIQLGNLQLLDLVTALEECTEELMAIAPPQPPFKSIPWGLSKWIVGAIALLTLGLTAETTTRSDRHPSPPSLSQPKLEPMPHNQSE